MTTKTVDKATSTAKRELTRKLTLAVDTKTIGKLIIISICQLCQPKTYKR
nr:MAG TPA: hypothetical protein [Caudoviricetes sp.]DAW29294.1 MAG TPA: hypothetical protein [Caudoviricetes sp.]